MKGKVFVGLSGGVDSAVSAALLQRAGYDVTGVFIKIWQPEFTECTWREDRLDAMRVAAHLKIPYREIDLSDEYKNEVVSDMIDSYQRGITPNPDVLCNERIKFGHFLDFALKNGADYVATGHYARIEEREGSYRLLRGIDEGKDQSYFLYRLGQDELKRSLFPAGALRKSEIRKLAEEFGLPVAQKRDSQGLCFVGPVTIPEFLGRYIDLKRGSVLDGNGAVIGEHDGAALYTIGQRHGFRAQSAGVPLYVTAIDAGSNTITVSSEPSDAARERIAIENVHWIGAERLKEKLSAQCRYHEQPVGVYVENGEAVFESPHAVSPGQSVVFYDGDACVGGAIAGSIHTKA